MVRSLVSPMGDQAYSMILCSQCLKLHHAESSVRERLCCYYYTGHGDIAAKPAYSTCLERNIRESSWLKHLCIRSTMWAPVCGRLATWHPSSDLAWSPCHLFISLPLSLSSVTLCNCLSQCGLLQHYYAKLEGWKKWINRGTIIAMELYLFIMLVLTMSVGEWGWDIWRFEGL